MGLGRDCFGRDCWVLENNPTTSFYEKTGASFSGLNKVEETAGQEMKELAYERNSLKLFREPKD